jgi:hypothetical protein
MAERAVIDWLGGAWESLVPDVRIEQVEDLGDRVLDRARWNTRGQHSGIQRDLRFPKSSPSARRAILIAFFLDHEQASTRSRYTSSQDRTLSTSVWDLTD